jgi:hypothetical protein
VNTNLIIDFMIEKRNTKILVYCNVTNHRSLRRV